MSMSGGALSGAPPASVPDVFAEHVHGADLGAMTVLLDLRNDRYVALPSAPLQHLAQGMRATAETQALAAALAAKGLLRTAPDLHWFKVWRACLWAKRMLAGKRLDRAARALGALRRRNGTDHAPQAIVQAFETMRPWYPRRRVCLFDSLALMRVLTGEGAGGDLVFGVRGMPFSAHCWVEHEGRPLNDEPAYCASFRTIWRI